jgi:hypothetical protein
LNGYGLDTESLVSKDVLIVCDLMSGACNPHEIKSLQKALGEERVRTRDGLHAKVWLTDKGAIVGSSNVSANGLGFEGDELKSSIEANVFIDDAETLAEIGDWFETDVMDGARKITRADLEEARRRWKIHRATRPTPPSWEGSVLDVIRNNPSELANRDFLVWVNPYGEMSRGQEQMLEDEQEARGNSQISCWVSVTLRVPPNGAHVLDFWVDEETKEAKFDGLVQILKDDPLVRTKQGNFLFYKPVTKFFGLPLGDKRTWERAATEAYKTRDTEWTIEEFIKKFKKFLNETV